MVTQAEIQALIDQIIPKADFPAEKMNPLMNKLRTILYSGRLYVKVEMVNDETTVLHKDTGYVNLDNSVVNYTIVLPENPELYQAVNIFTLPTGSVSTELTIKNAADATIYSDVSTNLDTLRFLYDGENWVLQGFSRFVA